MKLMVTNGGPHPADKWADTTTEAILDLIQIDDDSTSPQAAAARQVKRELRGTLFNIFMPHFDGVQSKERGDLKKAKVSKVQERYSDEVKAHFEGGIMAQVEQALAATPFAGHFAKAEVHDVLFRIVGQHTANALHIERQWHEAALNAKGN